MLKIVVPLNGLCDRLIFELRTSSLGWGYPRPRMANGDESLGMRFDELTNAVGIQEANGWLPGFLAVQFRLALVSSVFVDAINESGEV